MVLVKLHAAKNHAVNERRSIRKDDGWGGGKLVELFWILNGDSDVQGHQEHFGDQLFHHSGQRHLAVSENQTGDN